MSQQVSGRRRRREDEFSPGELFADGEQGAWYDPSDFATLYQDSAGTTPVTDLGQPVGLMLDKANWDGRGVVNLLTQTEAFDQSPWTLSGNGVGSAPVVTANASTAPDGSLTADRVDFDLNGGTTSSDSSVLSQQFEIPSTGNYTASIWIKAATAGDVGKEIALRHVQRSPWGIFALTADWQRVDRTEPASVTTTRIIEIALRGTVTTDDTVSVLVWGAQMEAGSTATTYQRVTTATDYADVGAPVYLQFDGVDDAMSTASIDFTSTDEMTVCVGVKKETDATVGIIVETGSFVGSVNGTFNLYTPEAAAGQKYAAASRGTTSVFVTSTGLYSAPDDAVITLATDISDPTISLRRNASVEASSTSSQGTGNYASQPMYIGARTGTSLEYTGRIHQLIVRGKSPVGNLIRRIEEYVANKTGVSL